MDGCSSNKATLTPFLAAFRAAIVPAGPPPMTAMSNSFSLDIFHPAQMCLFLIEK
jgi:hypothetical protein